MAKSLNKEILEALYPDGAACTAVRLDSGLINHTFKIVNQETSQSLLLQQINKNVFRKPAEVQDNYIKLWKYNNGNSEINLPAPVNFKGSETLFADSKGNYWRAFKFLENAVTLGVPQNTEQAKATARAFGQITAALSSFNIDDLNIVIPEFHNLSFRFRQFEESIANAKEERLQKAASLIEEFKTRQKYVKFYDSLTHSAEFPKRVMHHDAKIANVLFDKDTGKVICAIDFDTTMPGYFFSDLGDMIRSMACSSDENNTDFDHLHIRKDFYKAIVSGYLEVMDDKLTPSERKYLHSSGLMMIYMQGLRFMADYLNNDVYYQINYDEQNFDRSVNQITLLIKLEEFLSGEYNFSL